eukprot:4926494-Heterocapsa_arctica.AAC.1
MEPMAAACAAAATVGAPRCCDECGRASAEGRAGPPGSEYAGSWYCAGCWARWEADGARAAAGSRLLQRPAPLEEGGLGDA